MSTTPGVRWTRWLGSLICPPVPADQESGARRWFLSAVVALNIGGLLDVTVGAVGIGGLVWTVLLFPRLEALGVGSGSQAALLVSVLVLVGVLAR